MKTKKAAGLTAAVRKRRHSTAYFRPVSISNIKTIIGGLLLFGDKDRKSFWPFFEVTLRQYMDLRLASQSGSDTPGSANGRKHG